MPIAVTVVGSLNMDFVARVAALPVPGQTAPGWDFRMTPGGKGANQAYAAAKLAGKGMPVRMVGCVGHDSFADHLRASLSAVGVDIAGIRSTGAAPTGAAMICVDAQGQNTIVVAAGANQELRAGEVESMRPAFRDARFALFQLETPVDTVAAAMRLARECGAETMLDPAPARHLDRSVLELVSVLTPNESEACVLLGRPVSRIDSQDARARSRRRCWTWARARSC
jgi:ribokinase